MNPKGLYCPGCRGVRLLVTQTRRRICGVTVRHRRCSACGEIVKTEERICTRGDGTRKSLRAGP